MEFFNPCRVQGKLMPDFTTPHKQTRTLTAEALARIFYSYPCMNGKGKYKFKVIDGILSWKNSEMDRYTPVSPEILTRVILLYEKQMKNGLELWQNIEAEQKNLDSESNLLDLYQQLVTWMENLQGVFGDTEPAKEKEKERWVEEIPINLN